MAHVEEINDLETLERYRLRWRELLMKTPQASFFQSLDWLRAYWRCFGQKQRLRVLIVSSAGETIGIIPLAVRRERTRIGPVRVLTYPLHDWGSFYGPIGGQPAATLLAAMLHLRHTPRDWDLLDLRWIDPELDRGRTETAMELAGFSSRTSVWTSTCLLDLPQTWEDYFAGLSSKFRNNLRRAERRLARQGTVSFERLRPAGAARGDDDPQWPLYEECLELASRSWQGASHTGTTLAHREVESFLRQAHELAARNGALDVAVLRVDDRPVAFLYNYHTRGLVFGLRTGYDPALAACSPGSVLLAWMIRDSISRGDRQIDLGAATKEIKFRWRPRLAAVGRVTHYPSASPRAQLLAWKHRLRGARIS